MVKTASIYRDMTLMDISELEKPVKYLGTYLKGLSVPTQLLTLALGLLQLLNKYGISHINVLNEADMMLESDKEHRLKLKGI